MQDWETRRAVATPRTQAENMEKKNWEEGTSPPELVAYLGCLHWMVKIFAEVLMQVKVGKQEAVCGSAVGSPGSQLGALAEIAWEDAHVSAH